MSWLERLQEASYTASNEVEQTFEYEDVSIAFTNKGSAFNFPNGERTYIQRSGSTSFQIPLVCWFHGDNYDQEADAFMSLLRVRGVGKLKHPIYGTRDVIPLGEITRKDDLLSGANQASVSVTFLETTAIVFPTSAVDPESQVIQKTIDYQGSKVIQFAQEVDLEEVSDQVEFENGFLQTLSIANGIFKPIAAANDALLNTFNNINDSIVLGMNELLAAPDVLAAQTMTLINTISQSPALILNRLAGYKTFLDLLTGSSPSGGTSTGQENALASTNLYAQTSVIGMVLSVVETDFETQTDALDAAVFVLDAFEQANDWYDTESSALGVIDTGETYQALQDAVALAAGFLIEISFTLQQERFITLDAPRTVIDLVYELYGELDDRYDFFINSNNLTGDEILLLPVGKTVRYYV